MKDFLENKTLKTTLLILHIVVLVLLIVEYGFKIKGTVSYAFLFFYFIFLIVGVVHSTLTLIYQKQKHNFRIITFNILSSLFILFCIVQQIKTSTPTEIITNWIRWAIIIKLIKNFAITNINYKRSVLNPAQLFIISFLGMILFGALLLMLPNATTQNISFIDTLFTATSAVCVTGLGVVDTSSYFTIFGQSTIMLLIQAGGLGILTFAS